MARCAVQGFLKPPGVNSTRDHGGVRCKEKRGDWAPLFNTSGRVDVSGEMVNADAVNTTVYPVKKESGWGFPEHPPAKKTSCRSARGMTSKAVDMSRQTWMPPVSGVDLKAGSLCMNVAAVLCPEGLSLMAVIEDPSKGFLGGPAAYVCELR